MLNPDDFLVDVVRFWGRATDVQTIIQVVYRDGESPFVFFPTSALPRFTEELTQAIERAAELRGTTVTGWTPREVREHTPEGEPQEIHARSVEMITIQEALDGERIAISFRHDQTLETIAILPTIYAVRLAEITRNRLALIASGHEQPAT